MSDMLIWIQCSGTVVVHQNSTTMEQCYSPQGQKAKDWKKGLTLNQPLKDITAPTWRFPTMSILSHKGPQEHC